MIYILYRHQKIYVQMCFCVAEENHTLVLKMLELFCTPARHYSVCTRAHLWIDERRWSWWVFIRLMGYSEISYVLSLILMGHCVAVWHPSTLIHFLQFWHSFDLRNTLSHCCDSMGFFIFEYIYLLSACACYPITKTPGMSLFHSSSQSEIENSIKGLCWRCSARLKASVSTLLWYWMDFFPPQKPHHPSIHNSNTMSSPPAFSKPISLIASTGPGVIDGPGDTLTLQCT